MMVDETKDEGEPIKVTDRRKLSAEGDGAEDEGGAEAETPDAGEQASLPPATFAMLALSLSQSTLHYLGELADPEAGEPTVDLPMARNSIDILGMLQDKTRGNLTTEEEKLLENLLYDLRMKYVARKKG